MKAHIDRKYLLRLGLIALTFLGIAGWFLYDGVVTYPRQRERALVYQELEEEHRLAEWPQIAMQHGWPPGDPGRPKAEAEITMQLVIAVMASLPGLLYLIFFIRARGRWIEATETTLRTSWGRQLDRGQIVSLDKKKWKSKGIARVNYQQDGRKRRLLLDDWKYDAKATREILREVETGLDASQIVGGVPEPGPEDEQQNVEPAAGTETSKNSPK